jgi:NADH-quinone oxidoreductase subunit A
MGSAVEISSGIVGYLALFGGIGLAFVFVNLLLGRFFRPHDPHPEKLEIYECGEPAIGSSFVQFDLRFYVVALVFIIFDVEVAFLFPWASVFGKITNLRNEQVALVQVEDGALQLTPQAAQVYLELGDPSGVTRTAELPATLTDQQLREGVVVMDPQSQRQVLEFAGLRQMVQYAAVAVAFFFVVLLVGFAYEWRTGALDWVRAMNVPAPATVRTISPRAVTAPAAKGSVLASSSS